MKTLTTLILLLLFQVSLIAQNFWQELLPPTVRPETIDVSSNGNPFIVWDDQLIRSTDNGQSWDSLFLAYAAVSNFVASPTGPIYLSVVDSIRKSTDEGNSWVSVASPFYPILNSDLFITNHLGYIFIREPYIGNTYRSTNEGNSWELIGLDSSSISDITFKDELTFAAFYGNYYGLCKSSDNGDTWELISNAPLYLSTLFASKSGKLFASRDWNPSGTLFISPDDGETWITVSELNGISIRDIEENQFGHIFLATVNGVYKSTDEGLTWEMINSGLNEIEIWCQKLTVDSSGFVYVTSGTAQMLYRSTESTVPVELISFSATSSGGEIILNWSTSTELNNLGFEIQKCTEWEKFFTIGFVNGHGTTTEPQDYSFKEKIPSNGKYHYRLKQVDFDGTFGYSKIVEVQFKAFLSYQLEQNFPNPFNPSTTFRYRIPELSFVSIKLYDILGNEIETLVNEEKPIGTYEVTWYAEQQSSGVYFYQLTAGEFVSTKKMLLLR